MEIRERGRGGQRLGEEKGLGVREEIEMREQERVRRRGRGESDEVKENGMGERRSWR